MMTKNKLSIAFITFNRSVELIRAIESCKDKGIDNIRIFVWDNHSDEINRQNIETYVSNSNLDIAYKYSDDNLGVGGGRNAVWRLCNSEYVLFIDDDAVLETPKFLEKIVSYMDLHDEVGAAGVNIYEPETGTYLNCSGKRVDGTSTPLISNFIGACHIIRKSAVCSDTLYPDSFKYGSEELFLCMKLYDKGYKVVECSDLTALHMPSKINRCSGKDRKMNLVVNQYVIKRVLYPFLFYPINFTMFIMRLIKNNLSICRAFSLSRERSRCIETKRMKIVTVFRLMNFFGVKRLI